MVEHSRNIVGKHDKNNKIPKKNTKENMCFPSLFVVVPCVVGCFFENCFLNRLPENILLTVLPHYFLSEEHVQICFQICFLYVFVTVRVFFRIVLCFLHVVLYRFVFCCLSGCVQKSTVVIVRKHVFQEPMISDMVCFHIV